jgi:hypothetical protein
MIKKNLVTGTNCANFYAGRYICKSGRYIYEFGRYIDKSANILKNVVDKMERSPIKHEIDTAKLLSLTLLRLKSSQPANIYHEITHKHRLGSSKYHP